MCCHFTDGERERGGGRFDDRIDRTPDDWRSAPREEQPRDSRGPREGGKLNSMSISNFKS